ncbi:MAG: hypothetical protein ABEJ65_07920, partial [bacterium]
FVEGQTLLSVREGNLRQKTVFNVEVLQSGVDSFQLSIPEGMDLLSIQPKKDVEWKVKSSQGRKVVDLQLAYPLTESKQFIVETDYDMKNVSGTVTLGHVGIQPANRITGHLAISSEANVEVKPSPSEGLVRVDPSELPEALGGNTSKPILHAFKYVSLPYELGLEVKRHKDVAVLTTTADRADVMTVTTGEQEVTRVQFQVKNTLRQYLEVSLPEGAKLWSTMTNGRPVKPGKGKGENSILVPLVKSGDGDGSFPVEIIYYRKRDQSDWFGVFRQQLPGVDIPVSSLNWEVYVPRKWHPVWVSGDFETGGSGTRFQNVKSTGQTNRARGLGQSNLRRESGGRASGMLPVKIDIPRRGRLTFLEKTYYDPEEPSPSFGIWYGTERIATGFRIVIWGLGFLLALFSINRTAEKLRRGDGLLPEPTGYVYTVAGVVVLFFVNSYVGGLWYALFFGLFFGGVLGGPYIWLSRESVEQSGRATSTRTKSQGDGKSGSPEDDSTG